MWSLDNELDFKNRDKFIPYLDGIPTRGVQAGSIEGGWLDIYI